VELELPGCKPRRILPRRCSHLFRKVLVMDRLSCAHPRVLRSHIAKNSAQVSPLYVPVSQVFR
jgi:hypothetical protein